MRPTCHIIELNDTRASIDYYTRVIGLSVTLEKIQTTHLILALCCQKILLKPFLKREREQKLPTILF